MSLDVTSSRIIFRNADGVATFDSNERNLVLSNYIVASFNTTSVNSFNSGPREFDEIKNLGTCHALANVVCGFQMIRGRVSPIGGTVFLHAADETLGDTYAVNPTGIQRMGAAVWYHLEIVGGVLRARVFYRFPQGGEWPFVATPVSVWAFCGTFDN